MLYSPYFVLFISINPYTVLYSYIYLYYLILFSVNSILFTFILISTLYIIYTLTYVYS